MPSFHSASIPTSISNISQSTIAPPSLQAFTHLGIRRLSAAPVPLNSVDGLQPPTHRFSHDSNTTGKYNTSRSSPQLLFDPHPQPVHPQISNSSPFFDRRPVDHFSRQNPTAASSTDPTRANKSNSPGANTQPAPPTNLNSLRWGNPASSQPIVPVNGNPESPPFVDNVVLASRRAKEADSLSTATKGLVMSSTPPHTQPFCIIPSTQKIERTFAGQSQNFLQPPAPSFDHQQHIQTAVDPQPSQNLLSDVRDLRQGPHGLARPSPISKPKKMLHREVEQARRSRMAAQIEQIRAHLPPGAAFKSDKVSVLQAAVVQIQTSASRIATLEKERDAAVAEVHRLREQLRAATSRSSSSAIRDGTGSERKSSGIYADADYSIPRTAHDGANSSLPRIREYSTPGHSNPVTSRFIRGSQNLLTPLANMRGVDTIQTPKLSERPMVSRATQAAEKFSVGFVNPGAMHSDQADELCNPTSMSCHTKHFRSTPPHDIAQTAERHWRPTMQDDLILRPLQFTSPSKNSNFGSAADNSQLQCITEHVHAGGPSDRHRSTLQTQDLKYYPPSEGNLPLQDHYPGYQQHRRPNQTMAESENQQVDHSPLDASASLQRQESGHVQSEREHVTKWPSFPSSTQ